MHQAQSSYTDCRVLVEAAKTFLSARWHSPKISYRTAACLALFCATWNILLILATINLSCQAYCVFIVNIDQLRERKKDKCPECAWQRASSGWVPYLLASTQCSRASPTTNQQRGCGFDQSASISVSFSADESLSTSVTGPLRKGVPHPSPEAQDDPGKHLTPAARLTSQAASRRGEPRFRWTSR